MIKKIAITFDVDWAPDYMIGETYDLFRRCGGKSGTFYVTHECKEIRELLHSSADVGSIEIGMHPNLAGMKESSLSDFKKKLEDYYGISIVSSRFHRLEYSYRNLYELGDCGIKFDFSYLTYLQPLIFKNVISDNIIQFPYHFEDGTFENMQTDKRGLNDFLVRQKIVNVTFHPFNVYMNTSSGEQRKSILDKIDDLTEFKIESAKRLRDTSGFGTENIFIQMLHDIQRLEYQQCTSSEYADEICNYW